MAFLTWNNGTLGVLPNLSGIGARTFMPAPTLTALWGTYSQPYLNPWWVHVINGVNATWWENIWISKVFPLASTGDFNRRDPVIFKADYGNILDDIVDPLSIFHTFRGQVTYAVSLALGNTVGLTVVAPVYDPPQEPPNPPLPPAPYTSLPLSGSLNPGEEIRGDFLVDAHVDHSSMLFTVCYDFTVFTPAIPVRPDTWERNADRRCYQMIGQRAVMIDFEPDWKESPPRVRYISPDDVFESDELKEQRGTAMRAPDMGTPADADFVRRITTQFKTWSKERSVEFYHKLIRIAHRRCAVPFWVEPLQVSVNPFLTTDSLIVNFPLSALTFESAEIVLFDRRDMTYETRTVQSINRGLSTITVGLPWTKDIPPAHAVFFMVLYCQIDGVPKRKWASDKEQIVDVVWRSL